MKKSRGKFAIIGIIGIIGLLLLSCGDTDEKAMDEHTQETESVCFVEESEKAEENESLNFENTQIEEMLSKEEETETQEIKNDSLGEEIEKQEIQSVEYTFVEKSLIMYAKQAINVRSLPGTEGERIGWLSYAQEVTVTGQCNETKWYRISYGGNEGYVSNNYLVSEKPVEIVNDSTSVSGNNVSSGSNSVSVTVPEQEETVGNLVWVPTNGGTKYHTKSTCSNMKDPMQVSEETAIENGYTPCKRCHK